jgi:hypothetical protein
MLPQLHIKDNFYVFIEAQVEKSTPEEKLARNQLIMTDIVY